MIHYHGLMSSYVFLKLYAVEKTLKSFNLMLYTTLFGWHLYHVLTFQYVKVKTTRSYA